MIRIKVDSKLVQRKMTKLVEEQLPFATARALTQVAASAQKAIRPKMPTQFTLRSSWTQKGVRTEKATKRRLFSEVYSKDDYMGRQEDGGIKRPRAGKHLAIPSKALFKKRRKPSIAALQNDPTVFKGQIKGTLGIWQRTQRKGSKGKPKSKGLKLIYLLDTTGQVKKRWGFEETVSQTVEKEFPSLFTRSLNQAIGSD